MSTMTLLPPDITEPMTTIRVPRRFDSHTVDEFRNQLDDASARAPERAIDGSDVVFVDRAAVESLLAAGLDDPASGLRLDTPSLAFRLTLELLGLESVLIHPMERAA